MVYVKKYRNKKDYWVKKFKLVHGDRYSYDNAEVIYNQRDKIPIECRKHGIFYQTPKCHSKGQGCPICGKEYAYTHTKRNWKHFVEESEKRFPERFDFPFIEEEYENSHSIVTVKCKRDGNVFKKRACDFITSVDGGCRECYKETFCKYYTHDELQKKTKFKIKPFEGEIEERKKVIVVCPEHGEYEVLIRTLLSGGGNCIACCNRKNEKEFIEKRDEFLKKEKEIYQDKFSFSIEDYKGWSKTMPFTCNDCGYTTRRTPMIHVIHGFRNCPKCAAKEYGAKNRKSNEQFIAESKELFPGEFGYDKCHYTLSDVNVTLKCNKCGKYFEVAPNTHLSKHQGCPYHYRNRSKAEDEIIELIKNIGGNPYLGYRELLEDRYELDIYDPERKIAIEYDGVFWHNENSKPKNYHLSKTVECESKGIKLLHIFEDEWKNKTKRDIWCSILKNLYGKSETKIYARKCEIKEVDKQECYIFLEENHLQGKSLSDIRLGLYYEGVLVEVMTLKKIKRSENDYELSRFCSKKYTLVIGGVGKLLKSFIKRYKPNSIISFADRRWCNGGIYEALGFVLKKKTPPNYYYVVKDKRKKRCNFRKNILVKKYNCPQNMSEHDFCKSKEWYRIYDCGELCYALNCNS